MHNGMFCLDRRALLAAGVAIAATVRAGARPVRHFFERHDLPVGLQLYALGADATKDLDATFRAVASIGYRTVEIGLMPERSPKAIRASLDVARLRCPSVHSPLTDPQGLGGDLAALADRMATVGARTVVTPFVVLPERLDQKPGRNEDLYAWLRRVLSQFTADDWKMNAEILNKKGEALARWGVKIAYHNHNFEFSRLGDTYGLEILLKCTDPALVTFEMDIGWVAAAGGDPKQLLADHPGRFTLAHIKDFLPSTSRNFEMKMDPIEVGSGVLAWSEILPVAYESGVRQFYVEQEPPFLRPPIESARMSFNYLSRLIA